MAKPNTPKDKFSEAISLAQEAVSELGGDAKKGAIAKIDELRSTVKGETQDLWGRTKTCTNEVSNYVKDKASDKPLVYTGIVVGATAALGVAIGASLAKACKSK